MCFTKKVSFMIIMVIISFYKNVENIFKMWVFCIDSIKYRLLSIKQNKQQWLHCRKWQFLITYMVHKWLSCFKKSVISNFLFSSSFLDVSYCQSCKNAENDYFDQRLACAAPKRWSKYTTPKNTWIYPEVNRLALLRLV